MATQRIHSGTLGNPQVGSFRATPRDSNAILTIRRHIGYFRNFLNFVHHGFAPGQHATAVGKALQTVISSGDYRNPDHSRFFEENVSEYFLAPLLLQYFDSYRKTSFGDQGIDRRSLYAHSAVYQTLVQVKLYRNKIGHDEITKFLGAIDLFERTNLRRPRTYGVFITASSFSAPIGELERAYRNPRTKRALFLIDRQKLVEYIPKYQKFYEEVFRKTQQFKKDESEENRQNTINAFKELHDSFIRVNIALLRQSFAERDTQMLLKRKYHCEKLYVSEGRYRKLQNGLHKYQILSEAFDSASKEYRGEKLSRKTYQIFIIGLRAAGISGGEKELRDFFDRKYGQILQKQRAHLKAISSLLTAKLTNKKNKITVRPNGNSKSYKLKKNPRSNK
ncbi:MAG: restriction endonuclease [Turneriella sp.]|nr:restriction endonuclease [Turneriella sp.]